MRRSCDHLLYDLSSALSAIIRPSPAAVAAAVASPLPSPAPLRVTPSGLASLLLGASLSLMVCGWVTFMIGFILMPWVIGLVLVLYCVGIVSHFRGVWRAMIDSCFNAGKSGPLFSKLPIM